MTNRSLIIRSVSFAAIACVALPIAAMAADKVKLKAKFPEGRQRYVEVSREIDEVMRGPATAGREIKVHLVTLDGIIEKVISSPKKSVELEITFDRKAMRFQHSTIGLHTYDSDVAADDASPPLREILAPAVGMTLTVKMDRAYSSSSVTGMKAIAKKMAAGVSPGNAFFTSIKDELDDANAAADWGANRFWLLPNKKLDVGATWTRQREESMPSLGGQKHEVQCKLDRFDKLDGRKVAIITYTGTVAPEPEKPASPGSTGLTISLVEGTFEGTATFDVKRREIIKRAQTGKTKLRGVFNVGGKARPALDIDLTSKTTTTVKSIQDRAAEKKANKQADAQEAEKKKSAPGSETRP